LVDFDHTLMDNTVIPASVDRACVEIAAAIPGVSSDALLAANTKAFSEYWPTMELLCAIGEADLADVSLEAWRRALEACGCDSTLGQTAFDIHQRIGNEMSRLFEDAAPFLDRTKAAGLRMALVTNSSVRSQTAKIELMGLTSGFDAIVISGDHGIVKHEPQIFHIALELLGCSPAEAWHVGDSLASDVAGAAAAGVVSVWLNRDGMRRTSSDPTPDIEISSLQELSDLLDL
jgi:putative hydrolase of the HAD superfamily